MARFARSILHRGLRNIIDPVGVQLDLLTSQVDDFDGEGRQATVPHHVPAAATEQLIGRTERKQFHETYRQQAQNSDVSLDTVPRLLAPRNYSPRTAVLIKQVQDTVDVAGQAQRSAVELADQAQRSAADLADRTQHSMATLWTSTFGPAVALLTQDGNASAEQTANSSSPTPLPLLQQASGTASDPPAADLAAGTIALPIPVVLPTPPVLPEPVAPSCDDDEARDQLGPMPQMRAVASPTSRRPSTNLTVSRADTPMPPEMPESETSRSLASSRSDSSSRSSTSGEDTPVYLAIAPGRPPKELTA